MWLRFSAAAPIDARHGPARSLLRSQSEEDAEMIYRSGDYVYPADLPRALLCRVTRTEEVHTGKALSQILKLEPLEGPWPPGTMLVRLDDYVVPAEPRQLWQGPLNRSAGRTRGRTQRDAA